MLSRAGAAKSDQTIVLSYVSLTWLTCYPVLIPRFLCAGVNMARPSFVALATRGRSRDGKRAGRLTPAHTKLPEMA
jgi:hypothetical protein